ncbi:MAG: DUF819 domain-containing protein [Thermoanaerobaculia bacterium]
MIDGPLALSATVAAVAAAGFWLESRFPWAEKLGASLLVIALGALLSNLGLVPASSPVYGAVYGPVTSLAIVWLLLAVDLRDLRAAGPRMLGAFALAVAATTAGALTAVALFGAAVGDETWRLAGTMVGTYSGGSLNFAAVGRAVELPESLFTAAAAADNVMTAVWMMATLLLPVWLGRFYPAAPPAPDPADPAAAGSGEEDGRTGAAGEEGRRRQGLLDGVPFHVPDVAVLLAVGLMLHVAAETVAREVPLPIPSVVWLTTFALAVGQLPPVRRLQGSFHLGTLALNLFFVVIGIGSRVAEILAVGVEIFYFTATVVLVHGVVVFVAARFARLDVETTAVASQASVGGPSTAMALAIARRRPDLALPGVMVGLLGYAAGNYLGLAVAHLIRAWGS